MCQYVILGFPTGRSEYNEMCKQIKEFLFNNFHKINKIELEKLKAVIEINNKYYPNKEVNLDL